MSQNTIQRARYRITGKVQGVGYRYWTWAKARELKLNGWVENQTDGSVTALLVGKEERIAEMEKDLGAGPPASEVREVENLELTGEDKMFEAEGFEIRR